jgi:hypothetical protein
MTALMTETSLRAHLLIQADPGTTHALQNHLDQVPGVTQATATSGPFDVVAHIEVGDEAQLQHVLAAARRAPGLARLCLCRTSPHVEPAARDWTPWSSGFAANA